MKSRHKLVFDPGGCTGHLRGCSFLRGWYALRRGRVRLDAAMVSESRAFLVGGGVVHHFPKEGQDILYTVRIAVDRCLPEARLDRRSRQSQTSRGYGSCGYKRLSRNAMERGV